jgi:uncharacterized membrane protein YraQ (UPF0718 family)/regulator of protease activity HflC (stomatin/prohibitin superfamily)
MTDFLIDWLQAIWVILYESGPYLLVGFFIAGALKILIPEKLIYRHLGQDNLKSVFWASLFGVPIPLCSCSVIPTAISLKRSGASKGATTSFLISTPETGVDSIGVTWALMDPIMTIVRPLSALVTAFFSGAFVNKIVRKGWDDQPDEKEMSELEGGSCCDEDDHGHEHDHDHGTGPAGTAGTDEAEETKPCCAEEPAAKKKLNPIEAFFRSGRYAFGTLMADLTPWFILGFIVAGLITMIVPDDFFGNTLPNGWMSMVAMLFIGIPLYICATASTPVAAALIAKGLDPGSALILLLAGPATNIATIAVVRGFLGRRVLYVYLGSIAVCSLLFGFGLNAFYAWLGTTPKTTITSMEGMQATPFAQLTGIILLLLLAYHANKLGLPRVWGGKLRRLFLPVGVDLGSKPVKSLVVIALLLLYASTGMTSVKSGQTGFLVSFGRLVRTVDEPGLVMHAPLPFARVEIVQHERLRSEAIIGPSKGLPTDAANTQLRRTQAAATEVLTLDDNLLKCTYAAHYTVSNAESFHFRLDDPAEVVRAFTEAALREVVLQRTADSMLIGSRADVQTKMREHMQKRLDELQSGIQVVAVQLDEVHASSNPSVHFAFRDVATSLEDKQRYVQQAIEYRTRRLADARAQVTVTIEGAKAQANSLLHTARGEAHAFNELRAAMNENPVANRLRLKLETMEKWLLGKKLVLVLDPGRRAVPLPPTGGTSAPVFGSVQPGLSEEFTDEE